MKKKHFSIDRLQGVIFDVDGILVDTESFQWLGWVEVIEPFGKTMSEREYLKYAGKQGDAIEAELIVDYSLPVVKNELLAKKETLLLEWFHSKQLERMHFAKEAVEYFQKKNFKMACASGSPGKEARLKLEKTGLLPFFKIIVSGSDVKRGKPYPDIYLQAAKAINVSPSLCLAFEDTQYGVASAKAAGLFCIAIPNAFSQEQDFSKADAVFENLEEAVAWLSDH